jgi:hypothetical protein
MARLSFAALYLGLALICGGMFVVLVETGQWIFNDIWSPILVWELLTHYFEWQPRSVSASDFTLFSYTVLDWRADRTLMGLGLAIFGAGLTLVR